MMAIKRERNMSCKYMKCARVFGFMCEPVTLFPPRTAIGIYNYCVTSTGIQDLFYDETVCWFKPHAYVCKINVIIYPRKLLTTGRKWWDSSPPKESDAAAL